MSVSWRRGSRAGSRGFSSRRGTRGPGTGVNAAGGGFAPRARRGRRRGAPVSSSSTLARSRKCDSQLTCRVRFITDEGHELTTRRVSPRHGHRTCRRAFLSLFHTTSHGPGAAGAARTVDTSAGSSTHDSVSCHVRARGSAAAGSSRLVAPPLLGSRVALPGPAGPGSVSGLRVPGSSPGVLPRSRRRGSASGRRWRSWF